MTDSIQIHQYDNGLALVTQGMDWLESVALSLLVPAGCSRDPADKRGLANLVGEMVQRGCGARDSHQFIDDLENLGVDHNASVANAHTSFSGAMPASRLSQALPIYADLIQRPRLPHEQLEDARLGCIQEIRALEDDLAQRAMLALRHRQYGDPYGRSCHGTFESVAGLTAQDVRQFFETHYQPRGAILSVAGKFDFPSLRDQVGELLGNWQARDASEPSVVARPRTYEHIGHESNQTHIAIAYPSVHYGHSDYYQARGAVGVLSDGMSSRLFTEVRENRGLCYAVHAVCHTIRDRGCVVCYAGTTTDRAQKTLDVVIDQLEKLKEGIQPDELQRLKARLKSALIMQQESSASRAGSIAADWYYLSRVQTLEEVGSIVDALTCQSINDYLAAHPPTDFLVVTLGQHPLEIPR